MALEVSAFESLGGQPATMNCTMVLVATVTDDVTGDPAPDGTVVYRKVDSGGWNVGVTATKNGYAVVLTEARIGTSGSSPFPRTYRAGLDGATQSGPTISVIWTYTGAACVDHITSAPVLSGTPGDTVAGLSWSAAAGDPRFLRYQVKRSTAPATPPVTVVANVGGLSHTDTGRTNGTTYNYKITPLLEIGSTPYIADSGPDSNIAAVTPNQSRPRWGSL